MIAGNTQIREASHEPAELPLTARADEFAPPFPGTLEELDVSTGFLADLALKAVSLGAEATTAGVAGRWRVVGLASQRLLRLGLVGTLGEGQKGTAVSDHPEGFFEAAA